MSTEYTVVIEKDEDGYYVGSVPTLQGCHTQGTSIDQLLERMQEAITLWLNDSQRSLPSQAPGTRPAPQSKTATGR